MRHTASIVKCFLLILAVSGKALSEEGISWHQKTALAPEDLVVVVNDADPLSMRVAEYYKAKRQIPDINMVHVQFKPGGSTMTRVEFQKIKSTVDGATPENVQAYALTWTLPYRVECMSITTAFAAGFDEKFCSKTCGPTRQSPYFNSSSRAPYTDHKLRPAMLLAGQSFEEIKNLIDRGVASDHTFPRGAGYLVSTTDKFRNIRAIFYPDIIRQLQGGPVKLRRVKADFIKDRNNVLFYFTGVPQVKALDTIQFVPGAIADHLTSAGGNLTGTAQMSSLRWLEAGATGSYGTVVEPCNYPGKFPHPGVVISHYLQGESLLEAYWKSVAWPGEGIFIGEPLAAPFSRRAALSVMQ